jgi:hypothetical protein
VASAFRESLRLRWSVASTAVSPRWHPDRQRLACGSSEFDDVCAIVLRTVDYGRGIGKNVLPKIIVASMATLLAMVVELTVDTRTETRWMVDNGHSYRPAKAPADHSRCGARGPRAHVRLLARRRATMDPAATRGLRTGRDAALPAVRLGHWSC